MPQSKKETSSAPTDGSVFYDFRVVIPSAFSYDKSRSFGIAPHVVRGNATGRNLRKVKIAKAAVRIKVWKIYTTSNDDMDLVSAVASEIANYIAKKLFEGKYVGPKVFNLDRDAITKFQDLCKKHNDVMKGCEIFKQFQRRFDPMRYY